MKSIVIIPLLLISILSTVLADDDEFHRDIRQAPIFFQNGLPPPRGAFNSKPPQPPQQQQQPPFQGPTIPKFNNFGGAPPQGFRAPQPPPPVDEEDEDEIESNSVSPSPSASQSSPQQQQILHFRQTQQPTQNLQYRPTSPLPPVPQQPIASAQILQPQQTLILRQRPNLQEFQQQGRRPPQQQLISKNQLPEQLLSEEELEDKEEPDRLTELLPQSKFSCNGKKTGYYADDGLNCEVFHYCQENARHSWICPEGFSFHQVHLICMPPSSDNICQQSSQFHFVNDFLYRPINAEEAQQRPNVTIRYADRYYPENYYETFNEDDNNGGERTFQQRQPVIQASSPRPKSSPQHFPSTLRPLAQIPAQQFTRQPYANHAFHNPEEINIPLQSRRPASPAPQPQRNTLQAQGEFSFDNRR